MNDSVSRTAPGEDTDPSVVLSTTLFQQGEPCRAQVTASEVRWTNPASRNFAIAVADILGITRGPTWAVLYAWPVTNRTSGKRAPRAVEFGSDDAEVLAGFVKAVQEQAFRRGPVEGRAYALIVNPFSGTGRGKQVLREIRPMFQCAGIQIRVFETEHAGHASEIARQLDPARFDGILAVGGDGTLHEVVNGLLRRPDWKRVIGIPVGLIPAGSGNGLSVSLHNTDAFSAAISVIKGVPRGMDLMLVRQPDKQPLFSFLSFSWGAISKVDIESEQHRWMGEIRFTYSALREIANLKEGYQGKILYQTTTEGDNAVQNKLRWDPSRPDPPDDVRATELDRLERDLSKEPPSTPEGLAPLDTLDDSWQKREGRFAALMGSNVVKINSDMTLGPYAQLADGMVDLTILPEATRVSYLKTFSAFEDGSYAEMPTVEYVKAKAFVLFPESKGYIAVDGEKIDYDPTRVDVYRGLLRVFC